LIKENEGGFGNDAESIGKNVTDLANVEFDTFNHVNTI